MSNTLHFKSPNREGLTLCGRQIRGKKWTADGDDFNPVVRPDDYLVGRCGNCRRKLKWLVRPEGKGMYLGCLPGKGR